MLTIPDEGVCQLLTIAGWGQRKQNGQKSDKAVCKRDSSSKPCHHKLSQNMLKGVCVIFRLGIRQQLPVRPISSLLPPGEFCQWS